VPFDDDGEEDLREFRPPPDPDDRLWRHPSEIGAHPLVSTVAPPIGTAAGAPGPPGPPAAAGGPTTRGRPWGLVMAAGLTGAALAGAGVLALGTGGRVVERSGVSQVALNPVASLPGLDGAPRAEGIHDRVAPAVAALTADGVGATPGSGVVVREDGIVLTSAGVLGDSARGASVEVRLGDAPPVSGSVVGSDPATGIGLVELAGDGYPTAVLAPARNVGSGDQAFAAGAAGRGREAGDGTSVVAAAVGTTARQVPAPIGVLDGAVSAEVTTDAPERLLGGPLLDGRGAVVGVTAAHERSTIFVTPVEVARRVADDLLATGRADRSWLGIEGTDARAAGAPVTTAAVAAATPPAGTGGRAPGTAEGGALVVTVVPGAPADGAGLRPDDVITAVDDRRVGGMADLVLALRSHRPGDRVELSVTRHGTTSQLTVPLRAAPRPAG
jgi:putative serine protease PepD